MSTKTTLERTLETLVELVDLARKQSNTNFGTLASSIEALRRQRHSQRLDRRSPYLGISHPELQEGFRSLLSEPKGC